MAEVFAKFGIVSWKTTLGGAVMVLSGVLAIVQATVNGTPVPWEVAFGQIVTGVGLLFAKDSGVTGGTVASTPEAVARVEKQEAVTAVAGAVEARKDAVEAIAKTVNK
jgi:molybdopterin biosynthesis enzyme MoaB